MQSARGRLVVRDDDDDDLLVEVEERLRCFCRCSAVLTSLFVVGKLLLSVVGLISSGGNGGKDAELISCALATMKRNGGDDGRCSHDLDDKEEHNIICWHNTALMVSCR